MKPANKTNANLFHYKFADQQMINFSIHSHHLTPKPIFDMHLPPELGVVLSGRMARYTSGVYTELPRGGVWWAGMLEPHGRQALEENSKVAVFIIKTDFFFQTDIPNVDNRIWQAPFNTSVEHRPLLIYEDFAVLIERLEHLLTISKDDAVKAAQVQLTLLEIILHMNRIGSFNTSECSSANDIWRLRPAFDLIYKSSHPVDIGEAAKLCKMSPSKFSQLFAQVTSLSFSKFSLRHRINQVAHELKINNNSLDELSEKWGFANKSHLVHRFKEYYNVTPSAYRSRQDKFQLT